MSPIGPTFSPITHPEFDIFLLGFIAACSAVAALFFLRFWKHTRDSLFLVFAVFFLIQGGSSASVFSTPHPNNAGAWMYLLRLLSVLLVLGAILRKNYGGD